MSGGFYGGEAAAYHVGAARPGAYAGDAGLCGHADTWVQRVEGVNGAQLRRDRVVSFVVVASLATRAVAS